MNTSAYIDAYVTAYHAKLDTYERARAQAQWQ